MDRFVLVVIDVLDLLYYNALLLQVAFFSIAIMNCRIDSNVNATLQTSNCAASGKGNYS